MAEFLDELLEIYDKPSFHETVARDLNDGSVWFNAAEFGKMRKIDGVEVMSIFCSDKRTQVVDIGRRKDERSQGIYSQGGVLFLRADEVDGEYKAGSPLDLDGRLYTVERADLLQGIVWRITLEANDS